MIRPVNFAFNTETAVNNAFQGAATADPQAEALREFDQFVAILRDNGIDVMVIEDSPEPDTPDSIFPNNWVSFHEDGMVCLYPMFAANRRLERNPAILQAVGNRFRVSRTLDLSSYERQGLFLEGTGSMVFDRDKKIAYACLSPRTDKTVLLDFCARTGFTPEIFAAVDVNGQPIYHTNVMMCVADRYVVACVEALPDTNERNHFTGTVRKSGKELIPISLVQMNRFAGNMLQLCNAAGETLLVMSSQALDSLSPEQVKRLSLFNRIIHAPLDSIETNGGGSARCMLAEVYLPLR